MQPHIVILNVILNILRELRGSTTLNHLHVLLSIQWVKATNVKIMDNRRGVFALFVSTVVLGGHNTLSNNSAIKEARNCFVREFLYYREGRKTGDYEQHRRRVRGPNYFPKYLNVILTFGVGG